MREEPAGSKMEQRLWLRLLSVSNLVSAEIRRRLRSEFDVTQLRFDVLTQLHREPDGLRLGDLSRRMMFSNGNITGLIDRVVEEGVVVRKVDIDVSQRRTMYIHMRTQITEPHLV